MRLLSCRRQGILTHGPTPNPKCKLNTSPFILLPHLLDCVVISNDVRVVNLYWGEGEGQRVGYHQFLLFFFLCFYILFSPSMMAVVSVSLGVFCCLFL